MPPRKVPCIWILDQTGCHASKAFLQRSGSAMPANREEANGENSLRHKLEREENGIKATAWKSIPVDGIWHPAAAKQTECMAMGGVSHAEWKAGEHVAAKTSQRQGRAFCKDACALTCFSSSSVALKYDRAALQRSCPVPKRLVSPLCQARPVFWRLHVQESCRTGSFGEQQNVSMQRQGGREVAAAT